MHEGSNKTTFSSSDQIQTVIKQNNRKRNVAYKLMDSRKAVRIRLINIDAPEKKQDYGRWSTDMMKSLVAGKTVTVTYFQRDRYGRILGQVYAPDGMNVNQFMVRAGAAWVYEQYNTDPVLPVLQNEARQQKRGLWSDADPVPPWIWRHRK